MFMVNLLMILSGFRSSLACRLRKWNYSNTAKETNSLTVWPDATLPFCSKYSNYTPEPLSSTFTQLIESLNIVNAILSLLAFRLKLVFYLIRNNQLMCCCCSATELPTSASAALVVLERDPHEGYVLGSRQASTYKMY